MVKHVYYKKQATGCTWHLLSKMERQIPLSKRREQERKRKKQARQERLMIGYIGIKYPLVYKEAKEYYNKLNNIYPNKHDLLKTPRFRELQPSKIRDNMSLKIQLTNLEANKAKSREAIEQRPRNQETLTRQDSNATSLITETQTDLEDSNATSLIPEIPVDLEDSNATSLIPEIPADLEDSNPTSLIPEIPADLEDINPTSLIPELSADQMQAIINDLRADPELRKIMNECEEGMDEEVNIDMDIDITISDKLWEDELLYW